MFDDALFDHLEPRETADYPLHPDLKVGCEEPLTLVLAYCGRGTPYWNAITKVSPLKDEAAATERAARLFARLGIVGFKHCVKDGAPVPYTPDHGAQVLLKLVAKNRETLVDKALAFALNPENFRPTRADPGDLGKG